MTLLGRPFTPEDTGCSGSFGVVAERLYPDLFRSICAAEAKVAAYEAKTGQRVKDSADFRAATQDKNEASFVRWQLVRDKSEFRLHRLKRGF